MAEEKLPNHLGGHLEKTHIDGGTLRFLIKTFNITSMLDIGCSVGGMVRLAEELGIESTGIEGDWTLGNYWDDIAVHVHDFTEGPCGGLADQYDLAWCIEFLEHVEEQYMSNYMEAFQRCNYVVCTAAPPSAVNAHHFNLQDHLYWQKKFADAGFNYDDETTQKIRRVSAMKKPFMQTTGMFFKKAI